MQTPSALVEKQPLRFATLLLLFFVAISGCSTPQTDSNNSPLNDANQLVIVTTRDWNEVAGKMQCFERKNSNSRWRAVGGSFPVVVGRNGLGCGRGLHSPETLTGPIKKE